MKSFHLKTASLLIVLCFFSCQNFYQNKAEAAEQKKDYKAAIAYLKKCNEQSYRAEIDLKIANLYFKMDELDSSKAHYSGVFEDHGNFQTAVLPYATTLFYNQNYEEVKALLKIYDQHKGTKGVPAIIAALCNSILQTEPKNPKIQIKENEISLFSLQDYRNGSYAEMLSSHLNETKHSPWTKTAYIKLLRDHLIMDGTWFTEELVRNETRNRIFDGPESYSNDGKTLFFSRSTYTRNDADEPQLKTFTASKVDEQWTNIKECPFNSESYSLGHPCTAPHSDRVYFTSDMPGGYGGFDLYYSLVEEGNWSQPINLGAEINTPGNELFPFVDSNDLLFYVSDHHNTSKQMDVLISYFEGTKWMTPQVLNFKTELAKNDFGYRFDQANVPSILTIKEGFPDARRPTYTLSGIAVEKGTGKPVKGVLVEITTGRTAELIKIYSDENGLFRYTLEEDLNYGVMLKHKNSYTKGTAFSTKNHRVSMDYMIRHEVEKIETDRFYLLEEHFDRESYTISPSCKIALDILIDRVQSNSNIHIELAAHTDTGGNPNYNLILSELRAKAAAEYLFSQGVSNDRMRFKGHGDGGVLNGRLEFRVLGE